MNTGMGMAISLLLSLPAGLLCAAEPAFVAGLQPDRRPPGAPVISRFEPPPNWQQQALRGIPGKPDGLGFLASQGAWHTPFNQPGMPPPYDLRGLHGKGKK